MYLVLHYTLKKMPPLLKLPPMLPYEEIAHALEPGDTLVLFSDGVTEAQNEAGEEFGDDRLLAVLRAAATAPASDVVTRVFDAIDAFAGHAPQFDDITMFVVRRVAAVA